MKAKNLKIGMTVTFPLEHNLMEDIGEDDFYLDEFLIQEKINLRHNEYGIAENAIIFIDKDCHFYKCNPETDVMILY